MSDVWNKVYQLDSAFFGTEASGFALLCLRLMQKNNIKRILEIGVGHGRDSIFFASNGIEVDVLDYSAVGVEILNRITKAKRLPRPSL